MGEDFNCTATAIYWDSRPSYGPLDEWSARRSFNLVLFVLTLLAALLCPLVFFYGKYYLRYERLRVRRTTLVYIASLDLLVYAVTGTGVPVIGYPNMLCAIRAFLIMLIIPLALTNALVRLLTFFFMHELQQKLSGFYHANDGVLLSLDEEELQKATGSYRMSCCSHLRDLGLAIKLFFDPSISLQVDSNNKKRLSTTRIIDALSFVASNQGTGFILILTLIPFFVVSLIIVIVEPVYINGCTSCKLPIIITVELVGSGVLVLVLTMLAAYRVRNLPDQWRLRTEVVLVGVACALTVLGFVVSTIMETDKDLFFDFQLLLFMGFIAFLFVQSVYQVIQAELKENKCSRCKRRRIANHPMFVMDTNAGQYPRRSRPTHLSDFAKANYKMTWDDIMEVPRLDQVFEKFLASELGMESQLFLVDAQAWKDSYYDQGPNTQLARAKKIYAQYVDVSGQLEINIPHKLYQAIEHTLIKENSAPFDLFDSAIEEMKSLLNSGAVQRFLASKEFERFKAQSQRTDAQFEQVAASNPIIRALLPTSQHSEDDTTDQDV